MTPTIHVLNGELYGEESFRRHLRDLVDRSSPREVAARFGITGSYLSGLMYGRSSIGPVVAARFGFKLLRYSVYVPLDSEPSTEAQP